MISNIRGNNMGTASFNGKFDKMRIAQDFIVYPIPADGDVASLKIQSDKRAGFISLVSGAVSLYPGEFFIGPLKQVGGALSAEELLLLKAAVFGSASGEAGKAQNGVVQSDNSGAIDVFGN